MGALSKKTDQVAEGLATLIQQYRNKPKIAAFLTAYLEQIQDLENVYFDLIIERTIDNAVGVQLDGLGAIVGEDREGRSDTDFRLWIRARIQANRSNGYVNELIAITLLVTTDNTVWISQYPPASMHITIGGVLDEDPDQIALLLNGAIAAGVGGAIIYQGNNNPFQFDVPGQGFDLGQFVGAKPIGV